MLLAAYGGSRRLVRQGVIFLALSCALGGGVLAIGLLGGRGLALGGKGVYYAPFDLKLVLLSAAGCYVLLTLALRGVGRHTAAAGELVPVRLELDGRRAELTALVDTGNTLTDPASGQPVMVAEGEALAQNPFLDMTGHWASAYTTYLYDSGVVQGVAAQGGFLFQPDQNITRGEFALMVARWMGLDLSAYAGVELPFADLDTIPAWCLDAMKAMYAEGILQGSLDNGVLMGRATASISRAEAMTILGRIQGQGYLRADLSFTDAGQVAAWALPYVESLVGQGIISGYDNLLRPNDSVTRGEVAKMLYSML